MWTASQLALEHQQRLSNPNSEVIVTTPEEQLSTPTPAVSPMHTEPPGESTMVDAMEDKSDSPSGTAVPQSVQTPVDFSSIRGSRIFLDLCSGAGFPVTAAVMRHECLCFPVDKLIQTDMDLLDNSFFEPLLRICSSGIVGYAAASPNCGEYSRLKLLPGGPAVAHQNFWAAYPV